MLPRRHPLPLVRERSCGRIGCGLLTATAATAAEFCPPPNHSAGRLTRARPPDNLSATAERRADRPSLINYPKLQTNASLHLPTAD